MYEDRIARILTDFEIPCTEDVPTCVDTCGKLLACGEHACSQRCHIGPCGMVGTPITQSLV